MKTNIEINGTKESPEINPPISCQSIFSQDVKSKEWRKDILFNLWCWKTGGPHAEELI
jgi:hypothetical protein